MPPDAAGATFDGGRHVKFWQRHISMLPGAYVSGDDQRYVCAAVSELTARMTLAYFCLGGLDLLGKVADALSESQRRDCVDWIYRQQICALCAKCCR